MLHQQDIWRALDNLAQQFNMSASSMARQAGLDPTTFNKSKRQGADGKPRWPSTESLSKVLNMLGVNFDEFALLVSGKAAQPHSVSEAGYSGVSVPLIGLAQAGSAGYFDGAGFPVGEGWDDIAVPGDMDENAYALQISGDSMEPALRHGDRVVVSPNADLRKGDRVVVKTRDGEVMAKQLALMSNDEVHLVSINKDYPDRVLRLSQIRWMARIVWVSQ